MLMPHIIYAKYKLAVKMQGNTIRAFNENTILFFSAIDMLGLTDIRDIDSLFEPKVGTIFEFSCSGSELVVGGENGFVVFTVEDNYYPLELIAANNAIMENSS